MKEYILEGKMGEILDKMKDRIFLLVGSLFNTKAEFKKEESSKGFRYKVKLPEKLEPGLHTGDVVALELPKLSEGETFVGATVAVVTQLHVFVPYPGKYVDFDFNVLNPEQGDTATFVVPVVSRGKLGIGEVRAVIDIYTVLNERVATPAVSRSRPWAVTSRARPACGWMTWTACSWAWATWPRAAWARRRLPACRRPCSTFCRRWSSATTSGFRKSASRCTTPAPTRCWWPWRRAMPTLASISSAARS